MEMDPLEIEAVSGRRSVTAAKRWNSATLAEINAAVQHLS
jgi:hypothetical protein